MNFNSRFKQTYNKLHTARNTGVLNQAKRVGEYLPEHITNPIKEIIFAKALGVKMNKGTKTEIIPHDKSHKYILFKEKEISNESTNIITIINNKGSTAELFYYFVYTRHEGKKISYFSREPDTFTYKLRIICKFNKDVNGTNVSTTEQIEYPVTLNPDTGNFVMERTTFNALLTQLDKMCEIQTKKSNIKDPLGMAELFDILSKTYYRKIYPIYTYTPSQQKGGRRKTRRHRKQKTRRHRKH